MHAKRKQLNTNSVVKADVNALSTKLCTTDRQVKLISSDISKANKIQINNAIEKAFTQYDEMMGINFKIMIN